MSRQRVMNRNGYRMFISELVGLKEYSKSSFLHVLFEQDWRRLWIPNTTQARARMDRKERPAKLEQGAFLWNLNTP
jgi:hypothetical protein